MNLVHDKGVRGPGPYFDGPGPWTGSTEGVHRPGVHVLYFAMNIYQCSLSLRQIIVNIRE